MLAARRVFFSSLILIASTLLAQAADPVTLRVADSFPKGHYLVKLILEPWMDEVKKRTNNGEDLGGRTGLARQTRKRRA